jgi:hypothetical protein
MSGQEGEATTRPGLLSGQSHRLLKAVDEPDAFFEPHTTAYGTLSSLANPDHDQRQTGVDGDG